jgi:hypothetical protein
VTLYKTVATADGGSEQVEMSPAEEAAIQAEWAANEASAAAAAALKSQQAGAAEGQAGLTERRADRLEEAGDEAGSLALRMSDIERRIQLLEGK